MTDSGEDRTQQRTRVRPLGPEREDAADEGTRVRPRPPEDDETRLRDNPTAARPAGAASSDSAWREPGAADRAPESFGEGYRLRDRYTLIEPIGQGAMGQVWKARDSFSEKAQDRNPFVAIKVFRTDFENHPLAYTAMQREASRAMQLAHPNIVTTHNFDQDEPSGRTFIVMELLEGEPLDRLIRESGGGGIDRKKAWSIVRGMSEGLAYAHRKGYVHSDFKPGNVFLTRDGVPKVLDFGIARAARQADAGSPVDDADSVLSGYTAMYAAPEVLEDQPADTADDVFALGLVAYELLSGRHPFNRVPANEARARKLRPQPIKGLRSRQWRSLEKALAFTREKRFPNAAAFLRSLQGLTLLQTSLMAAVIVLSAVAGGLWYRGYLESLPRVPFSALPPTEQKIVTAALEDGRKALHLAEDEHIMEASDDAANAFARAYQHHPKDPDAVAGLKESADVFIQWCAGLADKQDALMKLREFQSRSEFYQSYRPLTRAIEELQSH